MHAPPQVDVEDVHELGAAVGEGAAADAVEQGGHVDVGAHDGVEDPFETQVGDALEAGGEGVDAGDGDGVGGGEAFAAQEAEERGFAGAVGWGKGLEREEDEMRMGGRGEFRQSMRGGAGLTADEQCAAARGKVERDIGEARGAIGELVCEVLDYNGGRGKGGGGIGRHIVMPFCWRKECTVVQLGRE